MVLVFFNWKDSRSSYKSFFTVESAIKYCKKHLGTLSQINRTQVDRKDNITDTDIFEAVLESYHPYNLSAGSTGYVRSY